MSINPIRTGLAAMLAVVALLTTAVFAAASPHEHANDDLYFDLLYGLDIYDSKKFSDQEWIKEGLKLCDLFHQGVSEDSATDTVRSDLGTSSYQAFRVVTAVEFGYGCFSPKVHGV